MSLPAATRLGPYQIDGLLGTGGMAEVYRARDVRLGREVAIKILPEALSSSRDALARFEREAKTASALNHPHLVTIYDIGEAEVGGRTLSFIAMELIHGKNLRQHMATDDRDTLLRHLANVADGLAKAHDAGVVHRDLKPENVMISEDGFAKVVDFGIAKRLPMAHLPSDHVTGDGYAVGTSGYMAPEQVRGVRDADHRTDIFALGCMLYEIGAGRHPFEADSVLETMNRILNYQPPPLPDATLNAIVRRCLAKDRHDRYGSMRDVAAALRAATTITAVKPVAAFARRRAWTAIAAAVVLVVLLAAAGAFLFARRTSSAAIDSIAVLPFSNATGKADADFLGAGIAEEVIRNLGRNRTLRVIASSSSVQYRNVADARKAGRELNVDAVLVGKLRAAGGILRLDTELVRAADGSALWSNRYERSQANVVGLEEELAADVSAELRRELAPRRPATSNAEAYQAYLRGRHELNRQTVPALKSAIGHFHRAIELDPEFALAYAWLAQAHGRQAVFRAVPARAAIRQERAEALKALSIDESLPDAHWALALIASFNGDDAEYRRRASRVLELDPNFAPAHLENANQLLFQYRFDEATASFEKARELDPMSPSLLSSHAMHLHLFGRQEQSLALLLNLTEQFPDYANGYPFLALVYSHLGRHDDALATMARTTPGTNPNLLVWKGLVLARAGRPLEARAIADHADELARGRFVSTYYRAQLRAALGDKDIALSLLEKGLREDEWMKWLPYDPGFAPLRGEPRFAELVEVQRRRRPV
jgi:eukaryotic-like serine/threonine-protein kinase